MTRKSLPFYDGIMNIQSKKRNQGARDDDETVVTTEMRCFSNDVLQRRRSTRSDLRLFAESSATESALLQE